jgi:putative transposase
VLTAKRDKAAALKLLKRIMKKYGRPRKIVTDGLRAYSAAMKEAEFTSRDALPHWPSGAPSRLEFRLRVA